MNPTEELRAEHEGILLMLRILETICTVPALGKKAPVEHLDQILEFLKVFADKCHHGKEETILFPALEEAGIPRERGPIGVMCSEHDLGRSLIAQMTDALEAIKRGSPEGMAAFADPALKYIELLRHHIQKENNVLFPMADGSLPREKQGEIAQAFDRLEEEKIGAGRHEAFHRMMEELAAIYLK